VNVRAVQGPRDLRAFIDLTFRIQSGDPMWVAPLRFEVKSRLSKTKNPFFEHGDAEYFIAERDGAVVGRIAAISNRLHNEVHDDSVAFFGFFECDNDREVAGALLDRAADWARERGFDTLRGPTSFSLNDESGLLVDGFDNPPAVMMAHNPPYYADLIEAAGFSKAKDLFAHSGGGMNIAERGNRAAKLISKRLGISVRGLEPRRFWQDVELIQRAYNRVWEKNWGFVPLTENEIRHTAEQFKPFYYPDLIPIAEREGEVIGFGLGVPDLNQALRTNRSGRLLPGLARVFWGLQRRNINRLRVLLLGVAPEYRGKGVDAVLFNWIWTKAIENGIAWGEASWILEDNPNMINLAERMTFKRYKTYRIYDRPL
jgi:GNAT superfamily N-acetyltransferase